MDRPDVSARCGTCEEFRTIRTDHIAYPYRPSRMIKAEERSLIEKETNVNT